MLKHIAFGILVIAMVAGFTYIGLDTWKAAGDNAIHLTHIRGLKP